MWQGPHADTGRYLSNQGINVAYWQPVGFISNQFPLNRGVTAGLAELRHQIDEHPGPFLMSSWSLGSIIAVEWYRQARAGDLLKAERRDDDAARALEKEAKELLEKLDQLAVDMTEGLLTARQVKISTDVYQARLDAIDRQQQDDDRVRLYGDLALGTPEVGRQMKRLITPGTKLYSPNRFRAIVDDLCEIIVMPAGRGHRGVGCDKRVRVQWK